jgi:site-specific recombinase XerD
VGTLDQQKQKIHSELDKYLDWLLRCSRTKLAANTRVTVTITYFPEESAAERAGIYTPGFGMHRFRHVNISWRQEVGAHPVEAQKCAGHASLSTTWRYTQVDVERERGHVRAILERLNGHGLGTDSVEVLQ